MAKNAEETLDQVVKAFTAARKKQGLSHEALAKKAKLTRPAISYIENGKRRPSLLVCLRLAHALDLKLWEVLRSAER